MPSKMYNRARMTVTSTGTGNLSLGVAVAGYQTFSSSGAQNGDTVSYTIEDGVNWEVGTGTFNSVAGTLSRTVTQSYNGTSYGTTAISVTTNAQVYITALATDIVVNGGALGTPSSGTLTNATGLPISTGVSGLGTGVATALGNATNGASGLAVLNGSGFLSVAQGGTGLGSLTAGYIPYGNGTGAFSSSANLFWDAATTRLGIGTASPAASIQIAAGNLRLANSAQIEWGGSTNAIEGNGSSNFLRFWTNNSPAMTLGASGNLAVGSTDTSQYRILAQQSASDNFGIGVLASNGTSIVRMLHNGTVAAINVSYIGGGSYTPLAFYTSDTERARIDASGTFRVKGAGTAGSTDAVQFSGSAPASAMTLDASGNLGVGTTSPQANIHAQGSTPSIRVTGSSGTAAFFQATSATVRDWSFGCRTTGNFVFNSGNNLGGTDYVTIDTSGNLLVGTTSSPSGSKKLRVADAILDDLAIGSGAHFDTTNATPLTIATGSNALLLSGGGYYLVLICERAQTGQTALFLLGNGTVTRISQNGGSWVTGTTPGASEFSIGSSGGNYQVYNGFTGSATYQFSATIIRCF